MSREGGANKVRVDINVTVSTLAQLKVILTEELDWDEENDRPPRSRSEILEMVLRKGIRAWSAQPEVAILSPVSRSGR